MSEPRRELDAQLILWGRELISLWMALFRAVRLYQSDNEAIEKLGEKIREKVNGFNLTSNVAVATLTALYCALPLGN